jgi:hypothetical protein
MNNLIQTLLKYRNYLFVLLLISLYLIQDYQTILFLRPQGIHFIRQTDGLSFVANYFNNGFNFFQPQVFNLQSIDGKAACEFPVLYYFTALLYLIFGEHEFILRLLTLCIASAGFVYLFKLLYQLLQDFIYATAFSFLFISSTVLLYYTNNFLPDTSALGFTLVGWYFFFKYFTGNNRHKSLFTSFIFFSLASLLKVTYFINPVAAILSHFVYAIYKRRDKKVSGRNNILLLTVFIVSLTIVLGWNLYVIYYNKFNHDSYFLIQSRPLWNMDSNQIAEVWKYMTDYWYSKYYYQSTFHIFVALVFAGTIFIKKSERMILIPSFILAAGSICYFMLFYAQFKEHDYYFIGFIPAIIFLIINSFIALKNKFPEVVNHFIPKLLLLALCILSLNYAREKLIQRYKNTNDMYANIGMKLADTRKYIDSLGIPPTAKFVIVTDRTPNGGLYFINRRGWNVIDTSEAGLNAMRKYISQGAEYVLLTDKSTIYTGYIGTKIGEHNGIMVYKL